MVGKKGARLLDRADGELLVRQYEAGTSVADIMDRTGLSDSWVRHQIGRYRKAGPADRAEAHLEALRRELIRAETVLMEGSVDAAVKRMRALNMLVKLENDLGRAIRPDRELPAEADDFDDPRAELERRINRIRAAREGKSISGQPEAGRVPSASA
ncbi:hypothetical protein V0U79_11790 [Hyphobacterium sp. HN65]|uniref:Helix-turn-helix domain-containing protein n=1 Tax=Hyphobacterium lacteum TaxID=3116575 RepID=A0ABU7LT02_9PROT|nr:hypothetical protein [Hyphobacterium sp. HN65]MEE2527051.1 hypothetical protein [Hyphobacterium sp. HN65]